MSQNIIKNYDARQMGGHMPGGAPLDLPMKTRDARQMGGARAGRAPPRSANGLAPDWYNAVGLYWYSMVSFTPIL